MVKTDCKGRVIEFSTSHNKNNASETTYGLIEISGVRLIGSIVGKEITTNNSVLLRSCGLNERQNAFYEFLIMESQTKKIKENMKETT